MFTGIIQALGQVREIRPAGPTVHKQANLLIETGFSDLEPGESVAINGVCLTVTERMRETQALFAISPETWSRTNLGALHAGTCVNLERALLPTTRLSGHWVQGHVDGIAQLGRIEKQQDFYQLLVELPPSLSKYCVEKGSIALDGISLTINSLQDHELKLMIIPHTWNHTNLSQRETGDGLNVEIDILAKYVERLLCRN